MAIHCRTYQHVEDAWAGGVEAWCRAASDFVLAGGQAWLLLASAGQIHWVKARLLRAGVPLFGLRFLDPGEARRELCRRFGLEPPGLGQESLTFLLRVRAAATAAAAAGGGPGRPPAPTRTTARHHVAAAAATVARHAPGYLALLGEIAAAGWLDEPVPGPPVFPAGSETAAADPGGDDDDGGETGPGAFPAPDGPEAVWSTDPATSRVLREAAAALRQTGFWPPEVDRRLRAAAARAAGCPDPEAGYPGPPVPDLLGAGPASPAPPLTICVLGWDAGSWPCRRLLLAALQAAAPTGALAYFPLPRDEVQELQGSWIETVTEILGVDAPVCAAAGAPDQAGSPWTVLAERLQGSDWHDEAAADPAPAGTPEMLVGAGPEDQVILARDFVVRWLLDTAGDPAARLAVLFPGRTPSLLGLAQALGEAGVQFEDNVGESTERALPWQIQRAVVDYHLDDNGTEALLRLVGLLNEHPESFVPRPVSFGLPLDPLSLRRSLRQAFAELQQWNARLLTGAGGTRGAVRETELAGPLRRLVGHLGHWPETLPWAEARRRWERCLEGFGLSTQPLEPVWARSAALLADGEPVPVRAFFEYLRDLIARAGATTRRAVGGHRPFARVVCSRLEDAVGQTWHSLLWMDSNEGVWPTTPAETPCLDDHRRRRLNALWAEGRQRAAAAGQAFDRGYLLTTADRTRLEHDRFYELLEHCAPAGRVAFASVRADPLETNRNHHPNEWSLRCWLESAPPARRHAEQWLQRWEEAVTAVPRTWPRLARAERAHLRTIFERRRDPAHPFDEYLFNFRALRGDAPGTLDLATFSLGPGFGFVWSTRELRDALHAPATFALRQLFDAQPWQDDHLLVRYEDALVGRLTHKWVRTALGGGEQPAPFSPELVREALDAGLVRVRREFEGDLRRSLHLAAAAADGAPHPAAAPGGALAGADPGALPAWWEGVLTRSGWAARRCLEALAERVEELRREDPAAATWFCAGRRLVADAPTPGGLLGLRGEVDLLLLDRPELAGASCAFVDVSTRRASSAAGTGGKPSGPELVAAAEAALARALGVEWSEATWSVLHPEGGQWDQWKGAALLERSGQILADLARRQGELCFGLGEEVADPDGHGPADGERLPLATTVIDPAHLRQKPAG